MFFRERKDTSAETIAEAAALLNRAPKRQGSNQYVIESVFDDTFKKRPDHEQIVNGRGKKTPEEQKYINTTDGANWTKQRFNDLKVGIKVVE